MWAQGIFCYKVVQIPQEKGQFYVGGISPRSNSAECKGRCNYKREFAAAMRPFAKLLLTLVLFATSISCDQALWLVA